MPFYQQNLLIIEHLETLPIIEGMNIKHKHIKKKFFEENQITVNDYPVIRIFDAIFKNPYFKRNLVEVGDVIATYRDYEIDLSPYWYYRIVTN